MKEKEEEEEEKLSTQHSL